MTPNFKPSSKKVRILSGTAVFSIGMLTLLFGHLNHATAPNYESLEAHVLEASYNFAPHTGRLDVGLANNFFDRNSNCGMIGWANGLATGVGESLLVGRNNTSIKFKTFAFGSGNFIRGQDSGAFGYNNDVHSDGCMVAGQHNAPAPNKDYSFAVGVGTDVDAASRRNGFVVKQNGEVIVPQRQGDIGMGQFD